MTLLDLHRGHVEPDVRGSGAPVNPLAGGQFVNGAHADVAASNSLGRDRSVAVPREPSVPAITFPTAEQDPTPTVEPPSGTTLPPAINTTASMARAPGATHVAALRLELAAAMLEDLEGLRIATENRVRSAVGYGLPVSAYEDQLASLKAMEHRSVLDLQRALRAHPLGPWVKRTTGIGEKQGARLIAAIGDPYWNGADDRPRRGPAELWAYCGYSPEQRRRKGVKSNWSCAAKKRAYLCAEAAVKAGVRKNGGCDDSARYDPSARTAISPYGATYLAARESWADRDTSDGHKHNHALRLVAKAILRDLWLEARNLHNAQEHI